MAAILQLEPSVVEDGLGSRMVSRIRTGHSTVRDLIVAALWMDASPVEMWPASP